LAKLEVTMGGFGSGKWTRRTRKTTTEETLALGIGDLPGPYIPGLTGVLTWQTSAGKEVAQVGYRVRGEMPYLVLSLHYQTGHHYVHLPIRLQTTHPHFGGQRYWLTCPVCKRRAGKIYRPPSTDRFACRHCHDLRYRSSQNSHKRERLSKSLENMQERVAGLKCREIPGSDKKLCGATDQ
jgi:hypothetical protein